MASRKGHDISAVAQTLCADLLDNLRLDPVDLPKGGTFFVKQIGKYSYVYHRIVYAGEERDTVVGKATKELALRVEQVMVRRKHRTTLAAAASAAGAVECDRKSWSIMKQLYETGLFDFGGIVVGTNAFLAMQNMLGIRWPEGTDTFSVCQTMDMDVTWSKQTKLVVPMDLSDRFASLLRNLGLEPQFSTAAKNGTPVYTDASGYSLEILVPEVGRPGPTIVPVKDIGSHAQSLRFLDFLVKDPIEAVILRGASAIKIRIPRPERYAVHKIALSDMRENPHKKQKDIEQAGTLLHVLISADPDLVATTYKEFENRGPAWRKRLASGFNKLPADSRDLFKKVLYPGGSGFGRDEF